MKLIKAVKPNIDVFWFGILLSVPSNTKTIVCDADGYAAAIGPTTLDFPWDSGNICFDPKDNEWVHLHSHCQATHVADVLLYGEDPSTLRLDLVGIGDHV